MREWITLISGLIMNLSALHHYWLMHCHYTGLFTILEHAFQYRDEKCFIHWSFFFPSSLQDRCLLQRLPPQEVPDYGWTDGLEPICYLGIGGKGTSVREADSADPWSQCGRSHRFVIVTDFFRQSWPLNAPYGAKGGYQNHHYRNWLQFLPEAIWEKLTSFPSFTQIGGFPNQRNVKVRLS